MIRAPRKKSFRKKLEDQIFEEMFGKEDKDSSKKDSKKD